MRRESWSSALALRDASQALVAVGAQTVGETKRRGLPSLASNIDEQGACRFCFAGFRGALIAGESLSGRWSGFLALDPGSNLYSLSTRPETR